MQRQEVINTNFSAGNSSQRRTIFLVGAFAAIYIIWGSTYLAIKYAIETLPTFLMAGSRFMIAGAILYAWGRFSADYERPKLAHWRTSFIVGTLLLLGGNGTVVLAEHYIPSSLAALVVATEPFWIVLLGWLWLGSSRPNLKVVLGLMIGFVGVYLLIGGGLGDSSKSATGQILGSGLVMAGALFWAVGSLYGLRAPAAKSPLLASGMQMLSGGFVLLLVGTFAGEWSRFDLAAVSGYSWLGFVYLVIFGSLIGFTAYSWLLKNAAPAMVATYAYVNPVIAVLLGWAVAGESFTGQMLLGAGIIVSSVMLITSQDKDKDNSKQDERHESKSQTRDCPTFST